MKRTLTLIAAMFIFTLAYTQNTSDETQRQISVTGSAEVIVSPDEIELEVVLKEHYITSNNKETLDRIEAKFKSVLKKNNIDQDKVIFGNSDYYWYRWWSYRNNEYKQKIYKIKLKSDTDILSFVQDLDFQGVHSLRISNSTNSKLQELRKEIKISAVKAAKEKAKYLLESIDEKVGRVISIEEVPDHHNYYWNRNQNIMSNYKTTNTSNEDIDNIATIKLRYEVKAKFEII